MQGFNTAMPHGKPSKQNQELKNYRKASIYIFMIYYGEKLYNPLILDWKFSFS